MAPDKHPEETRPSRHHMNHDAEGGKKHTPADWHQVRDLTRLVEHIIEDEELAREQEEYELLFNREGRRGRHHHHHHRVGPFPPCLRCALAGMHCSATQAGSEDDVRCRRCERNGERFCIRQAERVVGTLDPEALRGMLRKGAAGAGGRAGRSSP
ncbi:hypothetical protein SLS53_009510 [Cytospora paraplurivora]|uniref:Uncharacterized protein n=1 Tax=Cytospora paraplurivora TaxID=2898453 RepID=A0AAN9YBU1_9PEZI